MARADPFFPPVVGEPGPLFAGSPGRGRLPQAARGRFPRWRATASSESAATRNPSLAPPSTPSSFRSVRRLRGGAGVRRGGGGGGWRTGSGAESSRHATAAAGPGPGPGQSTWRNKEASGSVLKPGFPARTAGRAYGRTPSRWMASSSVGVLRGPGRTPSFHSAMSAVSNTPSWLRSSTVSSL